MDRTADDMGDLHPFDEIDEADFKVLAELVERRCGIHLAPPKRSMVSGRLRTCARHAGLGSVKAYCHYIFKDGGLDDEWPAILDAITTNKTDFFRESEHFDFLIQEAVPELLAGGARELSVWSAACSTGPEPYSIAMVLDQAAHKLGFSFHVYASDISHEVLNKAQRAIYTADAVEPVPESLRSAYVMVSKDRHAHLVRMAPELRRMVTFGHHNLLSTGSPWRRNMDIVFCRNVLIYFTRPTQEVVIRNLCSQMRVGGYLFLGHSESTMSLSLPIKQIRPSVYRRES
jgi:chemotaxis protein methyltransferase CheR